MENKRDVVCFVTVMLTLIRFIHADFTENKIYIYVCIELKEICVRKFDEIYFRFCTIIN